MKRKLTVESFNPSGAFRPKHATIIRLKGQWLHRLGFTAGNQIEVREVAPNCLQLSIVGGAL